MNGHFFVDGLFQEENFFRTVLSRTKQDKMEEGFCKILVGDPRCLSYNDTSVMSPSDLLNLWSLTERWTYLFSSL